ncbi:uncharacterized protein [Ptychodera flava]|uniref:uncharacterized protein n=1 Tax=Ptychodera flava TaxID=63121 RepID=UPI00396A8A81
METERIARLEHKLEELQDTLEVETSEAARDQILQHMQEIQDEIIELSTVVDSSSKEPRRSERVPPLTQKMAEFQETQRVKKENQLRKAFTKNYGAWKLATKSVRTTLKSHCTPETLDSLETSLHMKRDEVIKTYEALREVCVPEQEILRQTDTCTAITKQLLQVIINKKKNTGEENTDQQLHDMLQHDCNRSIFSTELSRSSHLSLSSVERRAEAAAELAAQRAELIGTA